MTTTQPRALSRTDSLLALLAYFGFVGLGMASGLLGLATPSLRQEFGLSLEAVGLLLVMTPVGYIVSSFFSGRLEGALGGGPMMLLASVILTIGVIGFGVAPTWALILLAALLLGLGSGAIDAGLNSYFTAHYGSRQMNWLHACFGVGITLSPIIMTEVLSREYSWRWGYVIVGLVLIVLTVLFLLTLRDWRSLVPEGVASHDHNAPVTQTLRLPGLWISLALFSVYVGLELGLGQWAPTLFIEGRGIDTETAGRWVSIYWGTFTIGRILFGIFDGYNIRLVLRAAFIGAVVGAVLLTWNPVNTVGFIGLALLGLAQAPVFPLLTLTTAERVGARHVNNAIGIQVSAVGVSTAILPPLIGVLAERTSLAVIAPFFLVVAVLMVLLYELTFVFRAK